MMQPDLPLLSYVHLKETTMGNIVKAAAVQISPVLYSRQGTVERVIKKIRELGKQGVQYATFPETVIPYYPYFAVVQTPLELMTGKEYQRLLEQSVKYRPPRRVPSARPHRKQTWSS